jgi:hypothetical protein
MPRAVAAVALCVLLLVPASANGRSSALTATRVRSGSHPAFVRVVVDFAGGAVTFNSTNATDPSPFDGAVRVQVDRPGVRSTAAPLTAFGVTTRATAAAGHLGIRLTSAPRRFKYLGITVLHAPERVVLDLARAANPPAARFGRPGCLTFRSVVTGPRAIRVTGRESQLFEHSFVLRVRGPLGGIVRERVMTATGPWSATLAVGGPRRPGTVEAVAGSAKDGSLDCLVQVPVTLGA